MMDYWASTQVTYDTTENQDAIREFQKLEKEGMVKDYHKPMDEESYTVHTAWSQEWRSLQILSNVGDCNVKNSLCCMGTKMERW